MKLYETLEQQLKEPNFVTDNGELKNTTKLSLNR